MTGWIRIREETKFVTVISIQWHNKTQVEQFEDQLLALSAMKSIFECCSNLGYKYYIYDVCTNNTYISNSIYYLQIIK